MTAFIVIVCVILVGGEIWRSLAARDLQLQEMTSASSNLARAMAQHAESTIKAADTTLVGTVERIEQDGQTPSSLERLHRLLAPRVIELPELAGIFVYDRDGNWVTNSQPSLLTGLNNADREYFIFHRTHSERGPHIGVPIQSRSTGKWIIPVSRRINDADGHFAGVALATIDVEFFSKFYASLDIGTAGAVALVFDNGIMVVRRPFENRFVGKSITDTGLFRAHLTQGRSGTFLTKSSQDGIVRLNSFRNLENYPLFVAAALSQDEILASWRRDTLWHAVGVALLVLVLALFGFRLVRQIKLQTRTEQDLAASLGTTRAIFDTATNPIITINSKGKIGSFNPAGERAFGFAANEIAGRNIRALVPEGYIDAYNAYTARFAINGLADSGGGLELAGLRKDGSIFPTHVSTGSMVVAGELQFVCVITDMTEQHKQRNELAAARDQLQLAADTAELGIWSWNLVDSAVQWNERMFDIYQTPRALRASGLVFEHWRSRVHPDDIEPTLLAFNKLIDAQNVAIPNFRIVLPDGQIRHLQMRATVARDPSGKPIAMMGINRDVTAQQNLETHLRMAKEQADAASAAKSSFLANMSHEIRTPMNAVLGMLHLVQLTALNMRQRDYVSKAEMAAKSLLSLLNDILDYSKIEAGKLQLDVHSFELESLVQELGVVLSGNQGDKEVEVLFDLDSALPDRLIGDSLRLQQVLVNLAGNALKFTLAGQVIVSVQMLSCMGTTANIRVAVTDSGIGISEEQMARIFEGFSQAEASTTRRFGGSGLGLVICKRLISLMGGDLKVDSRVGVGSRFWFDIAVGIDEVCPQSGVPVGHSSMGHRCLRLLIADDNPVAGKLLSRTVNALGWHADFVCGGVDAVKKVGESLNEHERYDVVLMDWKMPDLDGLNAAKLIRATKGRVPPPVVVMITAYGREVLADAQDGEDAPFAGFLTKPVTPRQLAETVLGALNQKSGPPKDAPTVAPTSAGRLMGMKLLVVEDNALNRQVADGLLRAEGANVHLADGGLAGVQAVVTMKEQFDAVLMDIQMPDIDGFEATRRIRLDNRFAALPIIAMTANASNADREACLKAGMNDHVGKPINLNALVSVLRAHAGNERVHAGIELSTSAEASAEQDGLIENRTSIAERFGGNVDLIERVLTGFGPETQKLLVRLTDHVESGNCTGAASVLHAIKGSAGTLGAKVLSMRAGQLEHDLLHSDESAKLDLLTHDCVAELTELLRHSLEQLCAAFGNRSASTSLSKSDPLPKDEWNTRLHEIVHLLESSNLQAIAAAEALSDRTHKAQRIMYDEFLLFVRGLDFAVAAAKARVMLEHG
ncbi:response regulator [Caballeronia sordidicola]|uniref:Sensory/regulatory protein RpfC n=1 Tax=Caballeronia sordidicola TaxID=196367 RepID=A0A226X531_CABSO|nr:response regulator [Caballeronia sordidicola]OXC77948.1 putative sensor/response regulator hybrid [Caballeronia sordidicola]